MCDYTQVQFCCGCYRLVVLGWCAEYSRSQKVCSPNIVSAEYRADEQCVNHQPPSPPTPWDWMIQRKPRASPYV